MLSFIYGRGGFIVKGITLVCSIAVKGLTPKTEAMKPNNEKEPLHDTTKDDSSDVQKVKDKDNTAPPSPSEAGEAGTSKQQEDEEAAKGHS